MNNTNMNNINGNPIIIGIVTGKGHDIREVKDKKTGATTIYQKSIVLIQTTETTAERCQYYCSPELDEQIIKGKTIIAEVLIWHGEYDRNLIKIHKVE